MQVETVRPNGPGVWVLGLVGQRSEQFRRVTLTSDDILNLTIADSALSYDGDGRLLRLALQAYSLGIAYEFDPYFGLSISRVDPLPHQLEAVYEHLLKLPSVRFLLADDAGAGKTIMAGLLVDGALSTKNVRRASYCRWVGLEGNRNSSARSVSFLPEPLTTYPLYQVVHISQATSDGNIKNYVITGLKWPLAAHPLLFPLAGHLRL